MTDRPSQLALRDLRITFSTPKALISLIVVGVLLGISGPFGTTDQFNIVPRLMYWLLVVFATYATGFIIHAYAGHRWGMYTWPQLQRIIILGSATGAGVIVVDTLINTAILGWVFDDLTDMLVTFGQVMIIAILISALLDFARPAAAHSRAPQQPPALLDRLPLDKRGALIALSVNDHYVNVVTTKGVEMVLMRLSDAIRETGAVTGLQVHRSHWVATDHVCKVTRTGDRAILQMTTGDEVPASRRYIPALREAGLLAKPNNG